MAKSVKILKVLDDKETIRVEFEYTYDSVKYTDTVPCFGTYTDEYVKKCLYNRCMTIEAKVVREKQAASETAKFKTNVGKTISVS